MIGFGVKGASLLAHLQVELALPLNRYNIPVSYMKGGKLEK